MLAALLAAAFVVIATQAGTEVGEQRVHDVGYWLRRRWLALLVAIGVLVVGISLFDLPYAGGDPAGRKVVKVTGGQFFWALSPDQVPAGTPIRFDVSPSTSTTGSVCTTRTVTSSARYRPCPASTTTSI